MKATIFHILSFAIVLSIPGLIGWGELSASENPQAGSQPGKTITLKIDGWTCASCEKDVRAALLNVPGVQSAEVSYPRGGAIVIVEPGKVEPDQLVEAIRGASNVFDTYEANVIPNGSLPIEKNEGGMFENFWSSLFN